MVGLKSHTPTRICDSVKDDQHVLYWTEALEPRSHSDVCDAAFVCEERLQPSTLRDSLDQLVCLELENLHAPPWLNFMSLT